MKVLQIVNSQHQTLAQIGWESPDKITVKVLDDRCEAELNILLDRVQQNGAAFRTGRYVEESGLMVDERVVVKPDDERFLEAIADTVSRLKFGGQRVFGLIKQQ